MLRRLLVILLPFFSLCLVTGTFTPVAAQLPVFRNYNTEDGLPSSETYQIVQDSRGYIYIGSDKGLTRFDGRHFETLTTQEGLLNNTLFNLQAHKDELWYYTYSSQVGYLRQDTAYAYRYSNIITKHLSTALGSFFHIDGDGIFYLNKRISYRGYEVIRILPGGIQDRSLSVPFDADYMAIYVTAGKRWLKSGSDSARKVKVFSLQTRKLLYEFASVQDLNIPPPEPYGYRKGDKMWLLYKDVYFLQGKTCWKIISCLGYPFHMLVDKDENIWIGYEQKGLWLYRKKDNYACPVQVLPQHSVSCTLEDREGGFWFTTLENGVYYLPPDFLLTYDQRTGLSPAKTSRINYFKKDALVWQSDFSLWRLKNATGNAWYKPLGNRNIHNAIFAPNRRIYTFTLNDRYSYHNYVRLASSKLFFDGKTVWGVEQGYLLPVVDDKLCSGKRLSQVLPYVICLKALPEDRLLVGTLHGLQVYEQGQFNKLTLNSPLDEERISDIKDLDEQHLLIATGGKGVWVLNKADFRIVRHIAAAEGLRYMICNTVLSDSGNVVWVGTNMGLYRIRHILDSAKTLVEWASIQDGIISSEINDICIVNHDLWLGTAKGVSIFPRNKKLRFEDSIPVLIQKLMVNGKAANVKAPLQLAYNQNNISISFIGLNYRYAAVLQYRYRLHSKTTGTWSYTSDPAVNYNGLPPGDYVFEYGAMAPNQYGKTFTGTLSFTISPPFWLRWWFILLLVLFVAAGISLFLHFRLRSIRRQVKLKTDLGIYRDKALRDQMSPHFIYNALNTIQNYILKHDTALSVSFLSKFSRLMRLIFNNTVQEMVTIEKDLEALQLYTQIESMRFPGKLNFHLPEQLPEHLKKARIPPLLLQPFVENAILHGLLPKTETGNVWVTIEEQEQGILVSIKDDGIGRAAAAKIKHKKMAFLKWDQAEQGHRKHSGTTITIARIVQTWEKYHLQSRPKITDLVHADGKAAGTLIQFYLPLNYDKSNNS